ncbi:MAG: PIN domain-containing protein [Verrucomicrobia bacterium]|nr:PIN domain-containing protein [Verrucomicrobiota bacterium]MDA1066001.1 PIN domain-containing protein [Verrucomicrobiota bacterium]
MIPEKLFLDTGCFIARELVRDQFHEKASSAWTKLADSPCQLYSSEHVFDECISLLGRRHSYAFAAECGVNYLNTQLIHWLTTTDEDLRNALRIMKKYADQGISFTDCISIVLMQREGLKHVFGFDPHFTAARFKLWPE